MNSDRWTLSPEIARAIEEFVRRSAWQTDDSAQERNRPAELDHSDSKPSDSRPSDSRPSDSKPSDSKPSDSKPSVSDPEPVGASEPDSDHAHDDCPELVVLTDLLGSPDAAHDVAALLVEVTLDDIADLDRSIRSCDYERAALRMHRIVGGYQILGPSLLVDEGRSLLAELRTTRSGSTLARLAHFRDRLLSLMKRIEAAVAMQRGQRLLRA